MADFRESIVKVLDDLNADLNLNPIPKARISKLNTWHIALEDISDENILKGFRSIIKTDLNFLPSAGSFRKFCISRQSSNISEDEKPYISESPEICRKNARAILKKLKAINKKC